MGGQFILICYKMKITMSMSIKLCIVAFLASILLSNCNANPSPNIKDYSQRFRFTDALRDILESPRSRRSEGGNEGHFFRAVRRTLPFQLVPQPPLAYVNTDLESEDSSKKASATEIMSI